MAKTVGDSSSWQLRSGRRQSFPLTPHIQVKRPSAFPPAFTRGNGPASRDVPARARPSTLPRHFVGGNVRPPRAARLRRHPSTLPRRFAGGHSRSSARSSRRSRAFNVTPAFRRGTWSSRGPQSWRGFPFNVTPAFRRGTLRREQPDRLIEHHLQRYPGVSPGDMNTPGTRRRRGISFLQRYPGVSPGDISPQWGSRPRPSTFNVTPAFRRGTYPRHFPVLHHGLRTPIASGPVTASRGPSNPVVSHHPARRKCMSCNETRKSERSPGGRHLSARRAGAARDPRRRLHRERVGRALDPETGW